MLYYYYVKLSGNRKLNALTNQGRYELAILIEDSENNKTFSRYDFFKIGNGASNYKLSIGEYSGTAGNILQITSSCIVRQIILNTELVRFEACP